MAEKENDWFERVVKRWLNRDDRDDAGWDAVERAQRAFDSSVEGNLPSSVGELRSFFFAMVDEPFVDGNDTVVLEAIDYGRIVRLSEVAYILGVNDAREGIDSGVPRLDEESTPCPD